MLHLSPIEQFKTFLFQPKSCAKSPLGKAAMVALSVLFGIATLGTVHLGVGVNFWLTHKVSPFSGDAIIAFIIPWDIDERRRELAEAAARLKTITGSQEGHEGEEEMVDHFKKLQETIILKLGRPGSKKVYTEQEKAELEKLYAELETAWESISAAPPPNREIQLQRDALRLMLFELSKFKITYLH